MLETSARLLKVLSLLQSPRDWTGTELAERLQVSPRTIRADIERLRDLGYPVEATRGSVGGYRLGAGANLPPLQLDDDEAVAVVVGLRRATGIAGVEEMSLRALTKLEKVMPSRLRRRISTLATYSVHVPQDTPGPQVDPELLSELAGLCRDHEQLRFDYADYSGLETLRRAEPHRLVNWGRRWYLLGYDLEREDWRTFRVDRMRPRIPSGPRFTPRPLPADGDVAAYVSRRVSAAAWRYRAEVVVDLPAEELAGRLPPAAGIVEPLDDQRSVFSTGSDSVKSLVVHLGLLDADFVVRDASTEVREHLETLAGRYGRATSS